MVITIITILITITIITILIIIIIILIIYIAILEFTDSNTEMRPQTPKLDVTNHNQNIRMDDYLNLQG